MRAEIEDLLRRMTAREDFADSEDSISWNAHREAEEIEDKTVVDELVSFLKQKQKVDQRKAAYFIIGKVGKNLQSHDCASSLLQYASEEKDKYAVATILNMLADISSPRSVDISPIFLFLTDKRWLVRHAAIAALGGSRHPEAEGRLLALLDVTSDPHDVIYCHAALNKIGTKISLPALERSLKSRKRDVSLSAKMAIDAIRSRETS